MKTLKSKIIALAVCSALTLSAFAAVTNSSDDATKATLSVSITAIKPHVDKTGNGSGTAAPAPAPKITTKTTAGWGKRFAFNKCTATVGKNDRCVSRSNFYYHRKCNKVDTYTNGKYTSSSYQPTTSYTTKAATSSPYPGSNYIQCD